MALQAVGSFRMCTGFWMGMVAKGLSGHINGIVFVGAVTDVVSILTSGDIWVDKMVVLILHICKEHLEAMPVILLV